MNISKRDSIGGYILFPGRGDDEHIKKRYYSASVESVNIGAFPLLPNSDSLLRQHLEDILMKFTNTDVHVAKAKPQRSLAYVTEEEKMGMLAEDLVMVAIAGSEEKRQWTFNNLWYNIPLDKIADSPWNQAKYLLLYVKGEKNVGNLCKIVRTKHDVWTKEKLVEKNYPDVPSHSAYFMIRIKKPTATEPELLKMTFDVHDVPMIHWGNHKMAFMLVKLKDLKSIVDRL